MKVGLDKSYPMPGNPEDVWSVLQNIEDVARCMPGAKITERLDDTHFKGTVAVKVGPASLAFKGTIEVLKLDATQRMLHLVGKGSDSSGTSGASLDLIAHIEPGTAPNTSNLIGKSEVSMSGKAAAFGGRMMGSVADQILNQFAENFAKQVAAIAEHSAAAALAGSHAPTPAVAADAASELPDTHPNEINALALFWAIVRNWFRGLFRRKPA